MIIIPQHHSEEQSRRAIALKCGVQRKVAVIIQTMRHGQTDHHVEITKFAWTENVLMNKTDPSLFRRNDHENGNLNFILFKNGKGFMFWNSFFLTIYKEHPFTYLHLSHIFPFTKFQIGSKTCFGDKPRNITLRLGLKKAKYCNVLCVLKNLQRLGVTQKMEMLLK